MEKRNKYKEKDDISSKRNEEDKKDEEYFNDAESIKDSNNEIIKSGLLKKRSPWFYYDTRRVILYNTPRIEYIDPETSILKGTIELNKNCSAELIKSNQFQLVTPKRTYIFMCKERYDISPWVWAINNAIKKYSTS